MKQRVLHALCALVLVAFAVSACNKPAGSPPASSTGQGSAQMTKVNVAFSEITFTNLTLWVAKAAGIFEKNGLDVDLQQINSANAIAALLAGQVQIAHAGGSETMSANSGG